MIKKVSICKLGIDLFLFMCYNKYIKVKEDNDYEKS